MRGKKRKSRIIRSLQEIQRWAGRHAGEKRTCGLVPTLGSLHEGHMALIGTARKENDLVAVSVFVNAPQFRKKQYLEYPRDLHGDVAKASIAGADVVFAPDAEQIYPEGFDAQISLPSLFNALGPQKIAWHYRAVLVVVMKLFMLVRPRRAYFGMKDPHQLALIEKMVNDLNVPVEIRPCPTVRDKSGLAYSSRNALLTDRERKAARGIYMALKAGRKEILKKGAGSAGKTASMMKKMISARPEVVPEHIEIVDAATLLPLTAASKDALIFLAVLVGGQRLTDNVRFNLSRSGL